MSDISLSLKINYNLNVNYNKIDPKTPNSNT